MDVDFSLKYSAGGGCQGKWLASWVRTRRKEVRRPYVGKAGITFWSQRPAEVSVCVRKLT